MEVGQPAEPGIRESIEIYFKDPKRVKDCDINEFIEYVSNRSLAFSAVGGVIGSGQGFTAGGMAVDLGAANAFRWGAGAGMFFATSYGIRALRKRDDALNYGISGTLSFGIYRTIKLGMKGAVTGMLMGAVGGMLYSVLSEELYDGLRLLWLNKRRFMLTENHVVRKSEHIVHPFPPRNPPDSSTGK